MTWLWHFFRGCPRPAWVRGSFSLGRTRVPYRCRCGRDRIAR